MKKVLKILALLLILILGAMILIPVLYKDKLTQLVKDEANKQLNATLDFSDVSLSFFSHFPELTLGIEDLSLTGVDHFEGVELIRVDEFELTLGLGSVLSGNAPSIESLYVNEAKVFVLIHPSGAANYDVVKAEAEAGAEAEAVPRYNPSLPSSESDTREPEAEDGSFEIHLKYYSFEDIEIEYLDEQGHMHLIIEDLDHEGSGNFDAESFTLYTKSDLDRLFFEYEGETYIDNWELDAKIDLNVDMLNSVYTLSDNEIKINQLLLKADGLVSMPDTSIHMDLDISAPSVDLGQLLSLAPAASASDLEGYEFGGESSFAMWLKGEYNDHSYPLFGLDIAVKDGSFHYAELPRSAEDIEIRAHIESPDAHDLDKMSIDISRFDMNLGNNPIAAAFSLRQPMSNMNFNTRLSASVDFESLKDVLPPEEYAIHQGVLKANLSADGSLAELEAENFDNLNASGKLSMEDLLYDQIEFKTVLMNFDLDKVELERGEMLIGESDLNMSGGLGEFHPICFI